MPKYKNEGTVPVPIKDINGQNRILEPGGEIETYGNYSHLTKTFDEPIWNPVVAVTSDLAGTSDSVTLNSATKRVLIYSDPFNPVINLFRGSVSRTPGEPILPGYSVVLDIKNYDVDGVLCFTSATAITAGKLIVTEYKDGPY